MKQKLIIIGIDGCRVDALIKAEVPTIKNLIEKGAYTFSAITNCCSISGPCWTSMLTGVWHDKHGVTNNEFSNMNISDFPHIFNYIKKKDKSLKTASIVNWSPINTSLLKNDVDTIKSYNGDKLVVGETVRIINNENPDAIFIQLDNMDHIGHSHDYGPDVHEYMEGLVSMDAHVRNIIESIENRKTYNNENWLIIIATDHGGIRYGHGGTTKEELTIFYILSGNNIISGEITEPTYVVDITAIALKHFDICTNKLDGKPHGLK